MRLLRRHAGFMASFLGCRGARGLYYQYRPAASEFNQRMPKVLLGVLPESG